VLQVTINSLYFEVLSINTTTPTGHGIQGIWNNNAAEFCGISQTVPRNLEKICRGKTPALSNSNFMLSTSCALHYDDVTVKSLIVIKCGNIAVQSIP